ncbi:hypothetical protein [Streptomyces sp. NPDC097610]|uniref:hypothetical protein n=1 Tax=Streptomyces sp. NPDC097610 TaxID=3157227 RepID=UPI00332DDD1C
MKKRAAAIAATVVVAAAVLTGCDPGPECAQYDTQTNLVTSYGVNGKPTTHLVTATVCVRYVEPKETGK